MSAASPGRRRRPRPPLLQLPGRRRTSCAGERQGKRSPAPAARASGTSLPPRPGSVTDAQGHAPPPAGSCSFASPLPRSGRGGGRAAGGTTSPSMPCEPSRREGAERSRRAARERWQGPARRGAKARRGRGCPVRVREATSAGPAVPCGSRPPQGPVPPRQPCLPTCPPPRAGHGRRRCLCPDLYFSQA